MISRSVGASVLALLLAAASAGCANTVAGTATDFPQGVQYDRIAEQPGQRDGEGGPPAMLSKPEGCSDGLTKASPLQRSAVRAARRSTASPMTARAS